MFKQFLMKSILFFALLPTAQAEIGIEDKNSFLQVNVSLDLQGIEDANALGGDRFEMRMSEGVQFGLQVGHGNHIGHITLVVLHDARR